MGRKANPTLIGAFVVGAIALGVLGIAVFGSGRLFRRAYEFVLYFDGSVNGLRAGAPVKFKGVDIGAVKTIRLNLSTRSRRPEDVRIPVIVEIDAERVEEKGGRISMDARSVNEMIGLGLRAQLQTESFVTGVLYVELDFFPDSPLKLVNDPEVQVVEIPTLPTTLQLVQMRASEIINKLGEVDVKALAQSVREALDGVNRLVNSPKLLAAIDSLDGAIRELKEAAAKVDVLAANANAHLGPLGSDLRATAERAGELVVSVGKLVEPGSPLTYQLGRTLQSVDDAARAIRELADYLERDPSALLRGKPLPEGNR